MNSSAGYSSEPSLADAISDDTAYILLLILDSFKLAISVPSTVLNGLNVIIFCSMGALDGVTVCFLSLSMADFTTVLLYSAASINEIFTLIGFSWANDITTYVLAIVFSLSTDFAAAVTTYIAVQRGLCVALPFLARYLFNKIKSLVVIALLFLFFVGCYLPRYSTFHIGKIRDPLNNRSTTLVINFMDMYFKFDSIFLIFSKGILATAEYTVMTVCALVIAIGMRSSLKLKDPSSSNPYTAKNDSENFANQTSGDAVYSSNQGQGHRPTKPESKELRVIQQSFIVVVVFVVFTIPTIVACLYMLVEPRFEIGAQYNNLYFVVFAITNNCYSVNTLANFFIYRKFNQKFKSRLYCLFGVDH